MKKIIKTMLVLGLLFAIFLVAYLRSNKVEGELKKNGKIAISRIDSIKKLPKWSNIYLSYYINNKKCVSFQNSLNTGISTNDIGKFYEMKYLPDSPEIVRGIYSKQVTDTVTILKAGFSIADIENSNLETR